MASVNVFIGPTEMNSAGTACVTTFHSPRQSFYSIVLLSPDFLSPGYAGKKKSYFNMNKSKFMSNIITITLLKYASTVKMVHFLSFVELTGLFQKL